MHNAAFAALGLDWVYVAFAVRAGHAGAAVDAMRTLGLAGLSVTMPHKAAVVDRLDRLGPTAVRLGAVNTISWVRTDDGDQLEGESTDGAGFVDALRRDSAFDPAGRRCTVLGAGGASRSLVLALAEARASEVLVAARDPDRAASCAALAGRAGAAIGGQGHAPQSLARAVSEAVAESALVVNATPVGMSAGDGIPFGAADSVFRPGQLVVDLVYAPPVTALLAAAAARGASTANGLGTLVHQAARQVAVWTGRPPPIEEMAAAAQGVLPAGR